MIIVYFIFKFLKNVFRSYVIIFFIIIKIIYDVIIMSLKCLVIVVIIMLSKLFDINIYLIVIGGVIVLFFGIFVI